MFCISLVSLQFSCASSVEGKFLKLMLMLVLPWLVLLFHVMHVVCEVILLNRLLSSVVYFSVMLFIVGGNWVVF